MEGTSSLGTYVAYAVIGLFLLVLGLAVVRTMMLPAFLLLEPVRRVWTWFGGAGARKHREEGRSD